MKQILIIGAGNMGYTYGKSFLDSSQVTRERLFFIDQDADKAERVMTLSDNPFHTEPSGFVRSMDLILLCVKPQDFRQLSNRLLPYLSPDSIVISIMAGVSIESIRFELNCQKVVRAMPNLPAAIGKGMTVYTCQQLSQTESHEVSKLLGSTGKALEVEQEDLLDAATAISGSGPAYVYIFMKAMQQSAEAMGFDSEAAELLVRQTFEGSIDLLQQSEDGLQVWIDRVSSKGGTTEAARNTFDEQDLESAIHAGLESARVRAGELREAIKRSPAG
ncbi:pyrroline-5-carboxylate reductase [Pontibacter sp. G13]|uniref:pyrroline-5-carboxylate reductase n=1 Tax=Pontibacter sp. G13 TaxID=3074898 RepID=UPI00288A39B4|nr:pyrroline-5-carboxylate reductase [Pontibacter sp. G13]WNJ19232.1 pyrroline-5-carboxylate reductase [Pontibacter sp. G13]